MASRPSRNSSRLRHFESGVYASDTFSGSRLFQASWAILTFCRALSSLKGGTGGLISCFSSSGCKLYVPPSGPMQNSDNILAQRGSSVSEARLILELFRTPGFPVDEV